MALETDWSVGSESQVRLISPITHNNNQSEIYIGLEYQLQKGWKTYWLSPGDGGFPQEIVSKNSQNIKALEIKWPTPELFEILGIQSIGYKDQVIFPIKISLEDASASTLVVFDINYLTCKDICIPGNAHLELNIPSGEAKLTKHFFILEKTLSLLPQESLSVSFLEKVNTNIYADEEFISFRLKAKAKSSFDNPLVYLHTDFGLPVINPNTVLTANSKNLTSDFIFDKNIIKENNIDVQFIVADQNQSFVINQTLTVQNKDIPTNNNYLFILLIAFLGGIILNVMPCVLPVLSIKLLSMLQHLEDPLSIRRSFIVTSIGIIFSFILLAVSFISLRHLGISIGWGMQFQQPIFLMIIGLILLFFSLNLFGLFEIPIPRFMNAKVVSGLQENYYTRDFFNGFFATIMATPCSAPFVGTALTIAFTQSSIMMLSIFIFMGIGMASPYFFVSIFPGSLRFFPKPGSWMIYLKYFMGLLLLGTLLWIGNILLNHFNYYFIYASIFLLLLILFFSYFIRYKKLILLIATVIFFTFPNFSFFNPISMKINSDWLDLTTVNLEELIEENILFIDVTADWCATCQFNKINVLNSQSIKEVFEKYNVIKIRGDWTKPNTIIEKFLHQHKKFGIPFNIIYNKENPKGIILSELLSENEIVEVLNKL
jgi:suppressor for copper-sensitivity B